MKENERKCFKCGRSPVKNPNVKLFRFPRPGNRNALRCELWAKFCFPEQECSTEIQTKLYSEHRMLCDLHFKPSSFMNFAEKKLLRNAVPDNVKRIIIPVPNAITEEISSISTPKQLLLDNITNIETRRQSFPTSSIESQAGPSHMQQGQQVGNVKGNRQSLPTRLEPQAGPSHIEQPLKESTSKERSLYIKCRKQLKKICQLRNRLHKIKNGNTLLNALETEESVQKLSKKITPALALILQGEIKNFTRKTRGRRWSDDQKITALRLYKRSPTCYNLLKRLFCLPSPSTLKKTLGKFPLKVGINMKIFEAMKKNTSKQAASENEYHLTFDEMSLRKHIQYNKKDDVIEGYQDHGNQGRSTQLASYALVFMICGIRKKVKQPVAYYLSGSSVTADRLHVLIKEVLYHCFEANINVSATVCDMDGVNRKALGLLGATSQNPSIEVFGHVITTFFDPPHLLKCLRNLFLNYDIKHATNITSGDKTGTGIAKWSHIQQFYDLDNVNPNFVFAPVLRQEHLSPNSKQKMRVKLAAQVMSHSVAAGMYCKVSQGEMSPDAAVTANFISKIDMLFDCLNSDSPDLRRGKPHSTNLSNRSPHLKFFQEMRSLFSSIQFLGCRSKPPSIEGWVWTLNAMELFWKKLITRHPSIKSLATRRLQQDPLENLFGCIRGHCGSNTNPTTVQFTAGLKTAILSSLATTSTQGRNCESDNQEAVINNYKLLLSNNQITTAATSESFLGTDFLNDLQENIENTFEESLREVTGEIQACAYVCGFILKKMNNHCTVCKKNLLAENLEIEHNFAEAKEYSQFKTSLKYSSLELTKAVEFCATAINTFLDKKSHISNLKQEIDNVLTSADKHFDFLQCIEHKKQNVYFIKTSTFHICVKRYCTLKNRKFIEEASAVALRKKINILKHN